MTYNIKQTKKYNSNTLCVEAAVEAAVETSVEAAVVASVEEAMEATVMDTVTGNLSFFMTPSIQFLNSLTLANTELLSFAEHLDQSNISIFRGRAFVHYNRFY